MCHWHAQQELSGLGERVWGLGTKRGNDRVSLCVDSLSTVILLLVEVQKDRKTTSFQIKNGYGRVVSSSCEEPMAFFSLLVQAARQKLNPAKRVANVDSRQELNPAKRVANIDFSEKSFNPEALISEMWHKEGHLSCCLRAEDQLPRVEAKNGSPYLFFMWCRRSHLRICQQQPNAGDRPYRRWTLSLRSCKCGGLSSSTRSKKKRLRQFWWGLGVEPPSLCLGHPALARPSHWWSVPYRCAILRAEAKHKLCFAVLLPQDHLGVVVSETAFSL
jgi:hypothetical protein